MRVLGDGTQPELETFLLHIYVLKVMYVLRVPVFCTGHLMGSHMEFSTHVIMLAIKGLRLT